MKRKVLSLILAFTLLFVTVSVAFPAAMAEGENLINNGNFAEYTDYTPTNWKVGVKNNSTAEIVENVEIADGVTANALKFTTSADNPTTRNDLYYTGTVAIEKNAKYTTTFWVKMTNIKGFRTYMFEPNFIAKDGSAKSSETASEGTNIYSFSFDNGNTRVIRTDIKHSWTVAETGAVIDVVGPSMFISRANGTEQPLTPDYPSTERQGEWLQVIHTFETGNTDDHEADISYHFAVPEAVDGELWIADINMTVEKSNIIDYYTPAINDVTLGCVEPVGEVPIYENIETVLTAVPFGENTFDGWYDGDKLVSTDTELSFMYEKDVTPDYEARFTKGEFGIDGSFENGYTSNLLLAQSIVEKNIDATDTDWTAESYLASEKEGSGFYIDSIYAGTWRKATITTEETHTGSYAVKFFGQYGAIGHKLTGLSKNANYTVSVYAYTTAIQDSKFAGVNTLAVTAADQSIIGLRTDGKYDYLNATTYDGVLNYKYLPTDTTKKWTKLELEFNTGDNEDVIFWLSSSGTDAMLYLDNYAIVREAIDYTPEVNDPKLGFVNSVSAKPGSKTTIVATTLGEAIFDGWYVDGERVSTDAEYTFTYDASNPPKYEARFTDSGFSIDGGYETGYTVDAILAQEAALTSANWTEDAFLASSKDGGNHYFVSTFGNNWRKASVTNTKAHTGNNSLKVTGQYGYVGKKIAGLQKNTEYIVSFYSYLTYTKSDKDVPGVSNVMVTEPDTDATILHEGNISVRAASNEGVLAKSTEKYNDMFEDWAKHEIMFNTGDNEEVILWMQPTGNSAVLYLDDFAVSRTAEINVELSRLGTTTKLEGKTVPYNSTVTITATPYEGNTFEGWYVGDELVCSDATYTFIANANKTLTPKFSGENTPDYEYFEAYDQDGTFENGTVGPWSFSDPEYSTSWCHMKRTTDEAYEGEYSLAAFSRHRNNVLTLNNLHAHTRYTLSFYFKLNEVGEKEHLSVSAITPTDVIHVSENATVIAKTENIPFTGEWQKYEITFNSGNYSEVNFVLRYATESTSAFLYIDNFRLDVGQYEEHSYDNACDADCNYCGETRTVPEHVYDGDDDLFCNECEHERAPLFTPGDINGDGNVNLEDVVTLAQVVAAWENVEHVEAALDPNGDEVMNLSDVVHLAQYVADWEGVELSTTAYVPTVTE